MFHVKRWGPGESLMSRGEAAVAKLPGRSLQKRPAEEREGLRC